MLLRLNAEQFTILGSKLERSGINLNRSQHATHAENRVFYQILQDLGFNDSRSAGKRAEDPNYAELGFDRVAGEPTSADIAKYAKVTNGATLTNQGFVTQALFFDNDLIPDRYSVATLNLLVDLYNKYLGRGNDFNHEFNATMARSRIIDVNLGSDPSVILHPDTPVEAMKRFSPTNPLSDSYTAFFGTLAFPYVENDQYDTINSVKSGLIDDISIAFQNMEHTTYCSVCLDPMSRFWFWSYCEEHGFPGGRTEDGTAVVSIMDRASDVFTFGLVSDGAVKRAGIVLDPFLQNQEESDDNETDEIIAPFTFKIPNVILDRIDNANRFSGTTTIPKVGSNY